MIGKILVIPLILVAEMALLHRFGIPAVELGIATLVIYCLFGLCGAYFVRQTFGVAPAKGVFDLVILSLQFLGVALLVASSSFSTATMNDGHFKPVGVLDFPLIGGAALVSTASVAVAMLLAAAIERWRR